jgi:hypothetical protein
MFILNFKINETKIWGKWLLISIDVEGFGKSDDIGSFLIWELMV